MELAAVVINVLSFAIIGLVGGLIFTLMVGDSHKRFPRNTEVALVSSLFWGSLTFFIPILSPHELIAGIGFAFIGLCINLFLYWAVFRDGSTLTDEIDENSAEQRRTL
jgi:hypothetical protein